MLGGDLRNVDGGFLGVARRAAIHVVCNVEEAALDPRARRGFRAVALVTVVALVVVVLYEDMLANAQSVCDRERA